MRTLLFTLILIAGSTVMIHAQFVLGTLHDFEDGDTRFWMDCFEVSTTPPVVIVTGGPTGDGDHYLRNQADGTDSCTGYFYTTGSPDFANDWTGVVGMLMDVRAVGQDLFMRIVVEDNLQGLYVTTNAVTVVAGSGWNRIAIPVTPGDFTPLTGTQDISTVLTNVVETSIISSADIFSGVDFGVGAMELDNIEASATLGIDKVLNARTVKLSPNPTHGHLNLSMPPGVFSASYEIFDILGKHIEGASFEGSRHSIDVQALDRGMYVLKLRSDDQTVIKRFVRD